LPGRVVKTLGWTWRTYRALRGRSISCINAHSLPVLPLAVALARRHRARLIYDTHELETETLAARGLRRPLLQWLERLLIGRVDGISVVSPGIAEWYRRAYRVGDILVARNLPKVRPGMDHSTRSNRLREKFGIGPGELLCLYQGVLGPGRRIDHFLRLFAGMPRDRHVVFMGFGPWQERVQAAAATCPNIHHFPAVRPEEVLEHTASADVGLCGVENACLSYYLSLPNKLFEFLAVGVPPLVPDFPEMREIVRRHRCGWVVGEDDADWSRAVLELNRDDIEDRRRQALKAASVLTWDRDEEGLLAWYRRRFRW
jgi:glycosyltransferase involved in cell wall biosynthesis